MWILFFSMKNFFEGLLGQHILKRKITWNHAKTTSFNFHNCQYRLFILKKTWQIFPLKPPFHKILDWHQLFNKKWQNQHLKTLADVRALHCKKSWKNRWTNTLKIVFDRGGGLFLMCGKTSAAWELIDFFFRQIAAGVDFLALFGSQLSINPRYK